MRYIKCRHLIRSQNVTAGRLSLANRGTAPVWLSNVLHSRFQRRFQSSLAALAGVRSNPDPVEVWQQPRGSQAGLGFAGKTGAQVFHEMMRRHQVKHIFGYPGGSALPLFDAIYNSSSFDFTLPRHEQGAGHMAQGYARATGRPGVVLVTSGPGSTNLVTPLQDALMDGTPMVAIAGQVPTKSIGSDAFQEADFVGIASACTKWSVMVQNVGELPRRIDEAFEIATTGRPGPVAVIIPSDVANSTLLRDRPVRRAILPTTPALTAWKNQAATLQQAIRNAASLINRSQKPIVLAGQGLLASPEGPRQLTMLAQKACIPVTTTLQGLGAFDEDDPRSLHMLGLHGSGYANTAIQEADLIIALGARFDDRVTGDCTKFAPAAKAAENEGHGGIIHFDIAPKNINKVVQATEAVVGDVSSNLSLLLPHVQVVESRQEWLGQIADWKRRFPWRPPRNAAANDSIEPHAVISKLSDLTTSVKANTLITTGVGQHQMWAAQYYCWKYPRTMITSGGLGTMGFGLPAAIGAKIGRPECLVINIDGDASFCMSLNELRTAAENNIAVKTLILNNEEQGMVTHLQSMYYDSRYSHAHQKNPDFVRVAEAMGVNAARADTFGELTEKLEWLLNCPGPALLEVAVDKKVPVLPTVPSGKGLHEFIL